MLPSRPRRRAGARPWICAEMVGHAGRVELRLWIPDGQAPFIAALLRAAYPGAELIATNGDAETTASNDVHRRVARIAPRAWLPLKTEHNGEALASLFATLARADTDERIVVSFAIRPRQDGWQRNARRHAQRLLGEQPNVAYRTLFGEPAPHKPRSIDRQRARAIDAKADNVGFEVAVRGPGPSPYPDRRRRIPARGRSRAARLRRVDELFVRSAPAQRSGARRRRSCSAPFPDHASERADAGRTRRPVASPIRRAPVRRFGACNEDARTSRGAKRRTGRLGSRTSRVSNDALPSRGARPCATPPS